MAIGSIKYIQNRVNSPVSIKYVCCGHLSGTRNTLPLTSYPELGEITV